MSIYDVMAPQPACHTPLSPLRFLDRAEGYFGGRIGLISGDVQLSWAEIARRIRRFANALKELGVGRGDTVSVLAPNGIAIYEAHFAVPMAGAVLNNINVRLDVDTVTYILDHCEARVLLVDTEFSALARRAVSAMAKPPVLIDIVDAAGPGGERIGTTDYESMLAAASAEPPPAEPASELQPISVSYTSGTTGRPKGVVYDHRNAFVESLGNMIAWNVGPGTTALWAVPIFHANGWCCLWPLAGIGATNVMLRRPSGRSVLQALAAHDATHILGAPIIAQFMAEIPREEWPQLTKPVRMLTAGSPPSPAHFMGLEAMGIQLDQGYGLSEVWGPAVYRTPDPAWEELPPLERARLKTRQGIPNLVSDAVIVANPETLSPVPRDGTTLGEVMFRGNMVMRGYLKEPAATAEAFAGGYFHSGDLAVWHPDGTIELRDRSKDLIISGGENISSIEIENAICEHEAVADSAVIGVPDPKWGETPWAFVELREGAGELSVEELLAFCRTRLAGFKIPKGASFGPIPRTPTGKVQKFLLRARLEGRPE